MRTSSEYRAAARACLSGKWATSALFYFVVMVVSVILSWVLGLMVPFVGGIVSTLIALPIAYGASVGFLRQLRGEELQLGWLFENFNRRVWVTAILATVYLFLWTLLLIIPGIIKKYSYAMTYYILRDNPELEHNAAIEKSMEMMDGHKMQLFILDLTFIGWAILCILTL